jgi:hypothetical protein
VGAAVVVAKGEKLADGTVVYGSDMQRRHKDPQLAVERNKEEMKPKLQLLKTILRPPTK